MKPAAAQLKTPLSPLITKLLDAGGETDDTGTANTQDEDALDTLDAPGGVDEVDDTLGAPGVVETVGK